MPDSLAPELNEVPLGTGPPTYDELRVYYTPKFSWAQLRLFINAGDLGLLKRDKALQERYMLWSEGIKKQYGSMVNYLMEYRLQWGKPDRLSLLQSELKENAPRDEDPNTSFEQMDYFTSKTPSELISVIRNDWPYSVPLDVEHSLVWTKLPILPSPSLIMLHIASTLSSELREKVSRRLAQDGLWGFTGSLDPPPSPSLLPQSLGSLSDWGVTLDKLVISPKGSDEEEEAIRLSGAEVQEYITGRWSEKEWETCWFVNPPRLQSVKGLAHIHVFARKKSANDISS